MVLDSEDAKGILDLDCPHLDQPRLEFIGVVVVVYLAFGAVGSGDHHDLFAGLGVFGEDPAG